MTAWPLLTLGPLALLARASASPAPRQASRPAATEVRIAGFALACALAATATWALCGPLHTDTVGLQGIGFALRLDAVSAPLSLLIAFVGWTVLRYSRNYLAGDPGQGRFMGALCGTLGCAMLLVLAGNLAQLALFWIATSLALQRLLLFYPERPAAVLAARKKWVASRLGDLCVLAACVLLYLDFGTLDLTQLAALLAVPARPALAPGGGHVAGAALLIACAALLKSAQLPLHGWILELMETPTPVSALLHAGIINAGGFLVLRVAALMVHAPGALDLLLIVGGLTALFASVVLLTHTSVKVSLAWSTIAQMGFMLLQCGLGAFPAALLHILAHSLYKAHAFLSSGSVMDLARASWSPSPGGAPHPWRTLLACALIAAVFLGTAALYRSSLEREPGVFALGAIALLGLTQLMVNALDERPTLGVLARTLLRACGVALLWFALQRGAQWATRDTLPAALPLRGMGDLILVAAVVGGFAAITILQTRLPHHAAEPRWQALYTHLANGLYLNTLANRLAIRLWPRAGLAAGERA